MRTPQRVGTDVLLQPLAIGSMTLRNRVVSSSHEPYYSEGGMPLDRYQQYHEEKAKGGVALTMIGGSASILPESTPTFGQLDVSTDAVVPHLAQTARRVHEHGAKIMCQISHMGRRARWDSGHWLSVYSSSRLREAQRGSYPALLEVEQLPRIIDAFGAAAGRVREAGLDGVEVAGHAGHLLHQFMSERMNNRRDEYGGDFQNRIRILHEVLEAVRKSVGPDFVVSLRLTVNEFAEHGLDPEATADIAASVAAGGLVDMLSLVAGTPTSDQGLSQSVPPFGTPLGGGIASVAAVKARAGDLPILYSGRLADLATARHALSLGTVDLVGLVRAQIVDPHLVNKLQSGHEEQIRPCVGASYCINRTNTGADMLCIYNPATGRESSIPHYSPMAHQGYRVVVVGGGPAGLEAARVAAERGHEVILFEVADRFGGQVRLAARATPRHAELASLVDWLEADAKRQGAVLQARHFATAADVISLSPSLVVVASGGTPALPPLKSGADLVGSTWDIISGSTRPDGPVLIYDEHGGEQALAAAEHLANQGTPVEFVTSGRMPGFDTGVVLYPAYLKALYEAGAAITTDHVLESVTRADGQTVAILTNIFTGATTTRHVSAVVAEAGTEPVLDVYDELKFAARNGGLTDLDALAALRPQPVKPSDGEYLVHRVGDAVASRNIHAAIYDARRLILTT